MEDLLEATTRLFVQNETNSNENDTILMIKSEKVINHFGQASFFQGDFSQLLQFILGSVLLTPVAIFGLIGNFLSICVLGQRKMRSSLSILLIGLSVCDQLVCTSSILIFGLTELFKKYRIAVEYLDFMCLWKKVIFPVGLTGQLGSTYFTVAVTIERFIAVTQPLKARTICTWKRAWGLTVLIILFSMACNIPRYISYAHRTEILHSNHTCESHGLQDSKFQETFRFIMYTIFTYLVPIITVVVFNVIIICTLQKQKRERNALTKQEVKEIKVTQMLLAVILVFVVCNGFRLFNAFTSIAFDFSYAELASLTNFLVTLNSAVNFIIFCLFGEKFRRCFMQLFCCGAKDSPRRNTYFSTDSNANEDWKEKSIFGKHFKRISVNNVIGLPMPTDVGEATKNV